jgi:pimeloyl-ACP methyl ester carboxylesterase
MFRNLIPLLAHKYRVIAPDLPGFGFTARPATRQYKYSFDNLAGTIEAFLDTLDIQQFAMYIFDYGAPVGLRIALNRPKAITAIVTQNGNAYEEGLTPEFWAPLRQYWISEDDKDRDTIRDAVLNLDTTKWMYVTGSPQPDSIPPESYHLDTALMLRPGNQDVQLDLFLDYRSNIKLYPKFQEYLRSSQVPVLVIWGKNDPTFLPAGAEAYRKDAVSPEIHILDASHFALEMNESQISQLILRFFAKQGI